MQRLPPPILVEQRRRGYALASSFNGPTNGKNREKTTRLLGHWLGDEKQAEVLVLQVIIGFLSPAGVAQLVEHQPSKLNVTSSSLVARFHRLC